MSVLSNAKHERFAQEMAKGKSATDAYVIAGYKPDDGNASKMATKPKIQDRVREITGKAAEKAGVSIERVLNELALIGFSNMQDYMRAGPQGDPYLDFSNLTREQAAALVEVTVEDFKDGRGEEARDVRRIKFKLADKRGALVDIGKHLGMFVEKHEHTGKDGGPIESVTMTTQDRARALASFVAKTKAQK
jgi:phage terminase small subunit